MRVCIIIRQFPEKGALVFGSGFMSQAYYLARALMQLGVEVHVLTERADKPTTDILNGIIVHRFPKFFTAAGVIGCLGYNFSEGKWIQSLLNEYNIDVIHAHAPTTIVAFYRSRKMLRQPLVVTFHGTAIGEADAIDLPRDFTLKNALNKYVNLRLQKFVDQYTCVNADRVTSVSHAMALEIAGKYKILPEKIDVIPNGVDLQRFSGKRVELRKKLKLGNDPVILYVGRLVYRKGITYLLQAIPEILKEIRNAKFVVVGKGPLELFAHEYAAKRGVASALTFLKDVPEEAMPEIYAACDALVLPSLYEAFGMVILEAFASEKAVVATRVGGIPEIINHGRTGLLVKPKNVETLKDSIVSLILDQNLRRRLAINGKRLVESTYDWGKIAKLYLALYNKVLEASMENRA